MNQTKTNHETKQNEKTESPNDQNEQTNPWSLSLGSKELETRTNHKMKSVIRTVADQKTR